MTLGVLSTETYSVYIGVVVIAAVLLIGTGWNIAFNTTNSLVAGSLCGFMHATVSLPGPPIMLLFQNESAKTFRSTVAAYLFLTSLLSLAMLYVVGRVGTNELRLAAAILPGTIFGYAFSFVLVKRFQDTKMSSVVLAFAGASGLGLILRGLY